MDLYWGSFVGCAVLTAALNVYQRSRGTGTKQATEGNVVAAAADGVGASKAADFKKFQRSFLLVMMLAMFSDWLQGPYVYVLYSHYGYDQGQIAQLFVGGFISSMVVGTFVGSLADKYGRKLMCVMFALTYFASCCTKAVRDYKVLMVGRVLGGVATSLLFSVFDSWMVCEHNKRGFDASLIGQTFGYSTFGNGLVAVAAGLIANWAVAWAGTPLAPFMIALVPLFLVGVIVAPSWSENYGNQGAGVSGTFGDAWRHLRADHRVSCLGLAQGCFEGSMYIFVFMWTPALEEAEASELVKNGGLMPSWRPTVTENFGVIFSVFMVCVMVGSSLFSIATVKHGTDVHRVPIALHTMATATSLATYTASQRGNLQLMYGSFLLFEVTVGMFYPSYGTLKSMHVPEEVRSAIQNYFRIPLNAFVVVILLRIKQLPVPTVFLLCTALNLAALGLYLVAYEGFRRGKGGRGRGWTLRRRGRLRLPSAGHHRETTAPEDQVELLQPGKDSDA